MKTRLCIGLIMHKRLSGIFYSNAKQYSRVYEIKEHNQMTSQYEMRLEENLYQLSKEKSGGNTFHQPLLSLKTVDHLQELEAEFKGNN